MTETPYSNLPESAFWRPAVAERGMFGLQDIWAPKRPITPSDAIVTFGSCFAQNIGQALRQRGFNWHVTERAPSTMSDANHRRHNYELFSARTGNIYTTSLLAQWVAWASGDAEPPREVWEKDGRFFDPFRPAIEPNGFASGEEMLISRQTAIACFKQAICSATHFVFTLGLTESWKHVDGYEYPMCPGTVAGTFDSTHHFFENQTFIPVHQALTAAIRAMRGLNKNLRFILTVSPVPLTATKSGNHVLVATTESKSVLRAVAGQFARHGAYVDYFPSYELITAPLVRGVFFAPNMRSVTDAGVAFVMDHFFRPSSTESTNAAPQAAAEASAAMRPSPVKGPQGESSVVCEEELLEAFS